MNNFNPASYHITIQFQHIEGEGFFVGTVAELPDVAVYEDSHSNAYSCALEIIGDLAANAKKSGKAFPAPNVDVASESSGRITLRMPKWLHAHLDRQANFQGVSLNFHAVALLTQGAAWLDQPAQVRSLVPDGYNIRTLAFGKRAAENTVVKIINIKTIVNKEMMLDKQIYELSAPPEMKSKFTFGYDVASDIPDMREKAHANHH